MKKTFSIVIGTLIGATIFGTGIYHSQADEANPKINSDQVRQMVEEQYSGTITELELEKDLDKAVYEVEVKEKNIEHDIKLDANTGEVLHESSTERKDDDLQDDSSVQLDKEAIIGVDKAKEIAKQNFDGNVISIELDEDDNQLVYEVELRNGKKEADFELDAKNGDIIEMDIDTEDDDD
ncbi:MAG: PepSY domain-containing protein [Bacillota bacterium]|uniref:PepSY domain-containing protein n=1 Tax=Virgibacillus salarius TaxID=447199 RepID=A0A941DZJ3_9BACI|nr:MULTISPECIES: PepSY domain-containing protein [Bacillaceae]NAZ08931.1 hypothetical protein [Agaribacter marinus]MBR7796223.1 PepSY domain-containing protein [Virgibacillus salarius]MCC2252379.1 PepSY domain-containing protein [Virgibacillus sp. AGTR]MDY7045132.1 PepSY domain-containing protein [Virgibacillus sp. M23]QRZ19656.1 PepSY domain-containing protein [Virgibacillus sp. AGTR]